MHLQDIYIYPIKSLGGIRVETANLEERGFQFDRRWMLVDHEGTFLSQRTFSKMALLQVEIFSDKMEVFEKNQLEMRLTIPFDCKTDGLIDVSIWEDTVKGLLIKKEINDWFSESLGMDCRLVLMPESTRRKLKPKYAVHGESVSFADAMPYLIIGQSSLDDLNMKLTDSVPMDRFRPNLVFNGGAPFEEDNWNKVKIGEAIFKVTKPCARCVMTTVDQLTGEKGKEPLRTLSTYRTFQNQVMFGQNMLLLEGKQVQVGDDVLPL
ncbi:MOSC domain-containing protein [Cecembia rubra]|uniref:MOSC domain-containing protein n=1 Tax=Cecembia rubra TaxID=1485585 RepID=UPI0027148532|nr:MOSC N-terminal beta barrel domain-containing protein [Cecembia rubra]